MLNSWSGNPVSSTAFYCCGIRMADARSPLPVCHDMFAEYFMDDHGLAFYRHFRGSAWADAVNVARCRIIDDWLRSALRENPCLRIVLVGAGFDSRAYRLNGGRWLELDEAPIIDHKNRRLSVGVCKNELKRIAVDFAKESLQDKLACIAGDDPAVVIIEGVLFYLSREEILNTIQQLHTVLPRHRLVCDVITPEFFNIFKTHLYNQMKQAGAYHRFDTRQPASVFTDNGYQIEKKMSVIERAGMLGAIKMFGVSVPLPLIRFTLGPFLSGYSVYVFDAVESDRAVSRACMPPARDHQS